MSIRLPSLAAVLMLGLTACQPAPEEPADAMSGEAAMAPPKG